MSERHVHRRPRLLALISKQAVTGQDEEEQHRLHQGKLESEVENLGKNLKET